MRWLLRLVIRRWVWIVAGLVLYAALNAAGVRASVSVGPALPAVAAAVPCTDVDTPPGCDPLETPGPTPTPVPTAVPTPAPTVVVLSSEDRDRLDLQSFLTALVGGLLIVGVWMTAAAVGFRS